MRCIFGSFLVAVSILGFSVSSAHADISVWQDPVSKVSLSVPDTWQRIHNQKPDDVAVFVAPGHNEFAACRMRVRDDKRFVLYPQRYSDEIQRTNFSRDFWDDYLGEYDSVTLHRSSDNAGLGRGYGSVAEATYVTTSGPKMMKSGIMFASLYNDKAYILECSAEAHSYDKWHDAFLSVAKSVDFRKSIHEFPAGNYRDFLKGQLRINGARDIDVSYY